MTKGTIAITGVSGFIASHAAVQLIERGYRVRGTTRDVAKLRANARFMEAVQGGAALELFETDLLDPAGFDEAFQGCDGVLHMAAPYSLEAKDPQADLVVPAVKGTEHVLAAAERIASIKRVVVTSSMAAVTDEPDGRVLTEADWNTKSSLTRNPYYFAKAEGERAAWDFMLRETPAFDLVVINPFLVIGPSLVPGLNTSNQIIWEALKGIFPAIMQLTWGMVDVRDVALAHVLALETPSASGRYLCAAESISMRHLIETLRPLAKEGEKLPKLAIDNWLGSTVGRWFAFTQQPGAASYMKTHLGRTPRFDTGKIQKELGLKYRDIDGTIAETVADLRLWGHLNP